MHIGLSIFYWLTGSATALFFLAFAFSSWQEGRPRPLWLSLLCGLFVIAFWILLFQVLPPASPILLTPAALVILLGALFFLPLSRPTPLEDGPITGKADERDVVFAREEYAPGTEKYRTYYARRPEFKEVDDKMRSLPELLTPGGRFFDEERSRGVGMRFREIEALTYKVDGPVSDTLTPTDPVEMAAKLKAEALGLGADEVGICALDPLHCYSHVGRGPEKWSAPIETDHTHALVFSLEMDFQAVETAPRIGITEETARRYLAGSRISIALAERIRQMGYSARAHVAGSNYQVVLPALGHAAGLGELGRMGYLISPRFGARTRLGAVTTRLPLACDRPIVFGVQEFCEKCKKCAANCPSGAIPRGGKEKVKGVNKWLLNMEKCIHLWRVIGTDCGLCMKACPYSHPPTLVHNLVRAGIKRSPAIAGTLSLWGDDLFYGRKVKGMRDC